MDAIEIAKQYNKLGVPGFVARAITYDSGSERFKSLACNGLMLHVTDKQKFRPVLAAVTLIKLVRDAHPEYFTWSTYPTHVNPTGQGHLDKLLGIASAESLFDVPLNEFLPMMQRFSDCTEWRSEVTPYLLYT